MVGWLLGCCLFVGLLAWLIGWLLACICLWLSSYGHTVSYTHTPHVQIYFGEETLRLISLSSMPMPYFSRECVVTGVWLSGCRTCCDTRIQSCVSTDLTLPLSLTNTHTHITRIFPSPNYSSLTALCCAFDRRMLCTLNRGLKGCGVFSWGGRGIQLGWGDAARATTDVGGEPVAYTPDTLQASPIPQLPLISAEQNASRLPANPTT